MRKLKEIKIDDKAIQVMELTVRQIYDLFQGEGDKATLMDRLDAALAAGTNIKREELMDLAPSDIEQIWEAFKEVNASFLTLAGKLLPENMLETVKKSVGEIFSMEFAALSGPATAKDAGITAGDSSEEHC